MPRWLHPLIVCALCVPGVALAIGFGLDRLGANPIEAITHTTGEWALRALLLCLAVTPARRLGLRWIAPLRRTFGLAAFAYAALHFSTWLGLDLGLDFEAIAEDLTERPYVIAGFTAFCLMLPLAATSTRAAIRRLGRRWQTLHRMTYAAGIAAILHYAWLVKADLTGPIVYGTLLAGLLGMRIYWVTARRTRLAR